MPPSPNSTEVLSALDDVVESLEEACAEGELAAEQARAIRRRSDQGLTLREVLAEGDEAPVVRQVAAVLHRLGEASSHLRRTEARALQAEGMSVEGIAELFGVSRQRISTVLHSERNQD